MNNYARLSRVKDELQLTGTSQDAALVRTIAAVSRAIDRYLSPRHFYSRVATLYFDGPGGERLWLVDEGEVLSVTSLKFDENRDGTYELTMAADTDYRLWPYNGDRKLAIDVIAGTGQRAAFPASAKAVQVVAKLGYSEDTESAGTTNEALDASETEIDMTAGHTVELGDTILVDSEQMYVSGVVNTTLTVTRGVNGTTAATHLTGATVSARRYPDDIEHAVIMQLTRYRWDLQQGLQGAVQMTDGGSVSLWPQVKGILQGYVGLGVAAEVGVL